VRFIPASVAGLVGVLLSIGCDHRASHSGPDDRDETTVALVGGGEGSDGEKESPSSAPTPWKEILGAPQGKPPAPQKEVVWIDNLKVARAEAADTGRPLFVTLRCLPCKQCADFDKDVLEGGPELSPLLAQFVTARLTDASLLDLHMFPVEGFQDTDLSWWGWFFSDKGELYGIFGGRDDVGVSTRISEAALVNTLKRVLAHHCDPRRNDWNIDGYPIDRESRPAEVTKLAGYESWASKTPTGERHECIHCHQVGEILRQPAIDAGKFDRQRDLQIWPLPENVGLTLDRDHGLLVTAVEPASPAAKAGIEKGDELGAAGGRRLFSQTDFRGVLHRGPRGAGEISVLWLRGGRVMQGKLPVAEGWRKTKLDWRMSVSQGNIGVWPGFFPLEAKNRRMQLKIADDRMAVQPYMGSRRSGPAYEAGLRPSHTIVAVNGHSESLAGRAFLTWWRLNHDVGDKMTIEAVRPDGERQTFSWTLQPRGHENE